MAQLLMSYCYTSGVRGGGMRMGMCVGGGGGGGGGWGGGAVWGGGCSGM